MKTEIVLLILLSMMIAGITSRSKNPYHVYSLLDICPLSGQKQEIRLRTGAAIFILNEEAITHTRGFLNKNDISCHLELEAPPSGYGFHVFMEDLNLDEDAGSSDNDGCIDYLQFGRDVFYVTTFQSKKLCGKRDPVFYHNQTEGQKVKIHNQGQRWYIEEKDHEMDIWIKIKRNQLPDRANQKGWRRIRLVVTVFKKNCGARDLYYRQCQHTNHCIRKDYFCDNHVNCAWPTGDEASDEKNCDSYYQGSYRSDGGSVLVASNIPVIIIAIIGVVLGFAVITIFVKRFLWVFQTKYDNSDRASVQEGADLPSTAAMLHPLPSDDGHVSVPPSDDVLSPAPPSYEEVIKAENQGRIHAVHDSQPPPYTPPSAPSST